MKCDEEVGSDGCQDLMRDRIRYFTGRNMTARDFRDADAYHRSFRHLHNRMLHGWGVVCGLEVEVHPRPECRTERVVVHCGLALDCCGREIVVPKEVVPDRLPWDKQPKRSADSRPDPDYVLLLCLRYREVLIEKVPVLYSAQACANPSMEDGRIRECYDLCWHWIREDALTDYGWKPTKGCPPDDEHKPPRQEEPPCAEDDHKPCHGVRPCCLDVDCPPNHCVPLAVIRDRECREKGLPPEIETHGRPSIAQAREHLTHICWISWPHGGFVRARDLHSLRVRFDRPLHKAEHPWLPGPRGINERTFVVQYGEQLEDQQLEDLDFVEYRRPPYLLPDARTAVYEVEKPRTFRSHILHVTLRCDFILDCHDNPVDGDHLRGRLPSGNGVAGGTFESWFRVVDDDECERLTKKSEETPDLAQES